MFTSPLICVFHKGEYEISLFCITKHPVYLFYTFPVIRMLNALTAYRKDKYVKFTKQIWIISLDYSN